MSLKSTVMFTALGSLVMAGPMVSAQSRQQPGEVEAVRPPDGRGAPIVVTGDQNDARETRERLLRLMASQYPPSLLGVLQRDSSLLHIDTYMASYPALAAFIDQHPEVARNPSYYFGSPNRDLGPVDSSSQRVNAVREVFEGFTVLAGFMSFFTLVGWVTKSIIDNRRWARVSKAQTDAHVKVIDRLTSNEDLLAYIQTPAGQRYLEAAPAGSGAAFVESPASAPYSRILWSVQLGVVATLVGIGFLFVSNRWAMFADWSADVSRMLFLVGVVTFAAGVGFVLSGAASVALSRRFGLIPANGRHA